MTAYPAHREADVVVRDGSTVHIRPVRPDDEPALLDFYRGLSERSRVFRFFSAAVNLERIAHEQSHVDYVRDFGLVATAGPQARIVGHGLYAALDATGDHAEVAFAIADDFQGRGLGTILLGQLAEHAAESGIAYFEAEVLPSNHQMLSVFRESGFPIKVSVEYGQLHVVFPTSLTPEALERFERREQSAAVSAMRRFLYPRSVAVIGASRDRASVGGAIFYNLLAYGFEGPVFPVNRAADVVQSVAAYRNVESIPSPVDLAVIATPAQEVIAVAEACGRKGVGALVVVANGFAEAGPEGRAREAELLRLCRAAGMRLIGPNSMGVLSTDPHVRLNATLGPRLPVAGRIGFVSQSGALGIAIMDFAAALGLGLSAFVSTGNKADISGNDLLDFWESDERTDVILLYLESFGNPRRFSRIARRVGRTKPIAVVKSARSPAGQRASGFHTGTLLAGADRAVDALFQQSGVIRTDTLAELFDVALLLGNQPVPRGPRVGIVSNAGGPAVLCADAGEARGLEVPLLGEAARMGLRAVAAPEASLANPVDLGATATAGQYTEAVAQVGNDPAVDAVIAIYTPAPAVSDAAVAAALIEAAARLPEPVPLLAVFMSSEPPRSALAVAKRRVPCYQFPEAAAIALAHTARYGAWRRRPAPEPVQIDPARRDEAAALVAAALARGPGPLGPEEVARLFACYGLPLAESRPATDADSAVAAARELGCPVSVEAVVTGPASAPDLDAGELEPPDGVATRARTPGSDVQLARHNLAGETAVREAVEAMQRGLAAAGYRADGFRVRRTVSGGVELVVGVAQDPQFGPVVVCGAGGRAEFLRDVAVRLAPLTREDAAYMVRELKTFPLLAGDAARPPCDLAALEDLLVRVGALADDLPQIAELDCQPVLVREHGATILGARVRVAPAAPRRPLGARR